MPYIEEDDLLSFHKQIDDAKKDTIEVREKLENVESNLEEKSKDLEETKKKAKKNNIILSLLTGIALALAIFFYSTKGNSSNNINIEDIKRAEAIRLLDSIDSVSSYDNSNNDEINENVDNGISTEESISNIKQNIKGETVYSVQVGAFYENRYASLSESLAGISSNGDMFKYSIGLFTTLKEAQKFRKELVKVGFDDAFVASYVNGVRKGIENPN